MLRFLVLIIFIASYNAYGAELTEHEKGLARIEESERYYKALVARYSKIPKWNPQLKDSPPVSINQAYEVARDWAKAKWPKSKGIFINGIMLIQAIRGPEGEWWDYRIDVTPLPFGSEKSTVDIR